MYQTLCDGRDEPIPSAMPKELRGSMNKCSTAEVDETQCAHLS